MFINTPYITKDHLQQKRFVAQNQNGTTYVYDFPEVLRQALHDRWKAEHAARLHAQQQAPHAEADGEDGKKSAAAATSGAAAAGQHAAPAAAAAAPTLQTPEDLLQATELIVDSDEQLAFITRPPGENEVRRRTRVQCDLHTAPVTLTRLDRLSASRYVQYIC